MLFPKFLQRNKCFINYIFKKYILTTHFFKLLFVLQYIGNLLKLTNYFVFVIDDCEHNKTI